MSDTGATMIDAPAHALVRGAYRHFLRIPTRWMDNDSYAHVNNTVYYAYI